MCWPQVVTYGGHARGHRSCLFLRLSTPVIIQKDNGGKPKLTTSQKPPPSHKDLEQKGTWEPPTLTMSFFKMQCQLLESRQEIHSDEFYHSEYFHRLVI